MEMPHLKIIDMRKHSVLSLAALILLLGSQAFGQEAKSANTITLTGQLVCSDCWAEADRGTTPYGTAADIACARDCAERGIPSALAVKENDNYHLYLIEQTQFKKNQAEWLDRIGGQVEITGKLYAKKGKQYVSVDSYKFLSAPSLAGQTAIGNEIELGLKDLAGVDQSLSGYRGRIVILNFWATWCVPCK